MRYLTQRAVALAMALIWLAGACNVPLRAGAAGKPEGTEPTNVLACRLASYGKFQDAGWAHLPSIGIKCVLIDVPPPEQIEATQKRLAEHGLTAVVLRGGTDLSQPTALSELAAQLETCEQMGVKYMFLSPKHPGLSKQLACQRLRQAGEIARKHGVTIALETHPDLGTNGDVHVETMKRIDHPNVRINFDTGNVTYYNRGRDAVTELQKCIDYVATLEFKDHNGQFESWNFPALGKGVVDFPAVVKILRRHGYRGPITIEVEGIRGVDLDQPQTKKCIEQSAAYVRSLDAAGTSGERRPPARSAK